MIRALYVTIALTNDMFTYNKIYEAFGKELKLTAVIYPQAFGVDHRGSRCRHQCGSGAPRCLQS